MRCLDARNRTDRAASAKPPNCRLGGSGYLCRAESDELALEGVRRGGGPRRDTELRVDVADVPVDGSLAQDEGLGDGAVGGTGGNQAEHLELARTEQVVAAREAGQVRHRAEGLEDRPSGVHLAIGGLTVAQGPAGLGEQNASAGFLVRRTRPDPGAERLTKQR